MIKILSIIVLVHLGLILIEKVDSKCERHNDFPVRTYKIDLDLPPSERFKQVVLDFKEPIIRWLNFEK